MKTFKKWLQQRNENFLNQPPAMVRSVSATPKIAKMRQAVNFAVQAIGKLLTGFGNFNESFKARRPSANTYSYQKDTLEPRLFPDDCSYVCKFLQKHNISSPSGVPNHSCGTEGCAYFYDNLVLKCTLGLDEYKIANAIMKAGNKIVPVVATDQEPETQVYLILSLKLNTEAAEQRKKAVDNAGYLLNKWFSDERIKATDSRNIDAVAKLTDFNSFKDEMSHEYDYQGDAAKYADMLFPIIVEIYRKSDFFITGDIHHKNIGFTPDDKPQMFDFGYPRKLGVGSVTKKDSLDFHQDSDY